MNRVILVSLLMSVCTAVPAFSNNPDTPPAPAAATTSTPSDGSKATLTETSRLSADLIYSVDRSPEQLFETARSVEVITSDEISRRSGRGLADILAETAGLYVRRGLASGGAATIRGLTANQVLILVDGVKLTNGAWGSQDGEYLNLIDLSQIDRVEIVRGVVSVLGTESLGGIINIITRKGPPAGESFAGTVGLRYATGDNGFTTPLSLSGQSSSFRYAGGLTLGDAGNLRGGGNLGSQQASGYRTRSGYGSTQYLMTSEKTISAMYSDVEQRDVRSFAPGIIGPLNYKPTRTQLASLSYQDVANRPWEDSLHTSVYWNRQTKGISMLVDQPRLDLTADNGDSLFGANIEGGKFLGHSNPHHLVYGVDFSTEKTQSKNVYLDEGTGLVTRGRADTIPGSKYQTLGVYMQDRFDLGSRLTASVGARYGVFSLKAAEVGDIGPVKIDTNEGDFAGSVNLIYHAAPSLNLIANAIRGFRTPNIYDATGETWGSNTLQVPTLNLTTEHVMSYELGAKYQGQRLSGSAFLFHNQFRELLMITPGTLNGLTFYDTNGNRKKDPWEHIVILQNKNSGAGTINGAEIEGKLRISDLWSVLANYTTTKGTNTTTNQPFAGIPPAFGSASVRFTPVTDHGLWGELLSSFGGSQQRLANTELADPLLAQGTPSIQVWTVRGGATLAGRTSVTLELENLFNKQYRYHDSRVVEPGRQFVLSTQYRF